MASAPSCEDVTLARAAAALPLEDAVATDPDLFRRLATADWSTGVVEEGGQFHRVLVLPGIGAVRMARTAEAADRLPVRTALVQALAATAELPFALPVPLTEVTVGPDGRAAVVQEYLPGQAHPPHQGDPAVLCRVCEVLRNIETAPLEPYLAPPFAFRGPWTPDKVSAVQTLPDRLRSVHGEDVWPDADFAETVRRLTEAVVRWTEDPVVPPSLVHGDLAGHNMRWEPVDLAAVGRRSPAMAGSTGWQLTGILDWDLATVWDPALNPAYLCLWHGEDLVDDVARDRFEAQRARVWLGAMALELLYDASLREGTHHPANWTKLLRKVLPRLDRADAALEELTGS
ncbi:aminoglycoside phosphotransferase family protein [Citricoccus sp. GCM10030269]|uniref:aminoglycoside phosphotransferase family protein n=1 Tax=Citricoccus sp. GCM10030269 TaxID=3273388 RepID=UPI00361B41A6